VNILRLSIVQKGPSILAKGYDNDNFNLFKAEGYVVIERILRLPLKSAGPFNTLEEKSTVTFDYISLGVYEMYTGREEGLYLVASRTTLQMKLFCVGIHTS